MTYKKPELLIPASSLEVLKTAVILERMLYTLAERLSDCVPRPKISAAKRWQREWLSLMPMA